MQTRIHPRDGAGAGGDLEGSVGSAAGTTRVWDVPVRVFHWTLVACFAGAYVLGEADEWRNVHVMLGYTVLGLIAFRMIWGFVGTQHARFRSFAYGPGTAVRHIRDEVAGRAPRYLGHNPAGSWAVYGLLALGLATGVTGYLYYGEIGGETFEEVHEVLANAWLALVVLHVLGVIFSSVMQRENLVRAMLTGRKQGSADGAEPRALGGVGLALVAAVVAFLAWNVSTTTPLVANVDSEHEDHDRSEHSELADGHEDDDD
jgi:cytochrome b